MLQNNYLAMGDNSRGTRLYVAATNFRYDFSKREISVRIKYFYVGTTGCCQKFSSRDTT
jgi:hypothetical protein